ncbi:MAG: hypothetical protein ACLQVN_13265 [Bryobacteraceae bacterium]
MEKALQAVGNTKMVWAVAAAAAHDINDELTIILGSVGAWLATTPAEDPDRDLLLGVRAAVERCAWKTSALLDASERVGVRPSAAPVERLLLVR